MNRGSHANTRHSPGRGIVAEELGRGTYRNTRFSESADMMPDHPLPLVLVENWHPLVLVGLAGFESLIDETQ